MKSISLIAITLGGFKSYTESRTISLPSSAKFIFLGGENKVNPRLGANGAGKSTLFDALVWCLYGTSTRGKRASDLISWGSNNCSVVTEWLIDGDPIAIARTAPPDRLTMNIDPVSQVEIDAMFLPRDSFLQSVIFGQDVPLFYDLSVAARGELLDEVLDLGMWMDLSTSASAKARTIKSDIQKASRTVAHAKGRLEGLEDIGEVKRQHNKWQTSHEGACEEIVSLMEKAEEKLDRLKHRRAKLKESKDNPVNDLRDRMAELRLMGISLYDQRSASSHLVDFFLHHRECPTCGQEISQSFADHARVHAEAEVAGFDAQITRNQKRLDHTKEELFEISEKSNKAATDASDLYVEIMRQTERIRSLEERATTLLAETENPYAARLEKLKRDHAEARASWRGATAAEKRLEGLLGINEFWVSGFKRVRLFLIRRTLDYLELEIANAASTLGLVGWVIKLSTQIETKSGTMRPGVHITIEAAQTARGREWSPGELQRIRLAVSFGLASLIQQRAGVVYNFEVMDEPSNWLSAEGIEDLLTSLQYRAQRKTVWLIDQRALTFAGFDEIWLATKTYEGTQLEQLTGASK